MKFQGVQGLITGWSGAICSHLIRFKTGLMPDIVRAKGMQRALACKIGLLALVMALSPAHAKDLDFSQSSSEAVDITTVARWAQDPQGALRFDEVRSAPSPLQFRGPGAGNWSADFGSTTQAYWLNFRISNHGNVSAERVLMMASPLLDQWDAYVESADGSLRQYKSGWTADPDSRPVPAPFFSLPLALGPGQTQSVWIRVQSPFGADASAMLLTNSQFQTIQMEWSARNAWRMGLCALGLGVTALLWAVTRRTIYPLYGALVLCAMGWLGLHSGQWQARLPLGDFALAPMLPPLSSLCLSWAAIALLRHALNLAKFARQPDRLAKAWMIAGLLLACLLVWPALSASVLPYYLGLTYLAVLLITAHQSLRQGWPASVFLGAELLPVLVSYGQTLADSAAPDPILMFAPPGHNGVILAVALIGFAIGLQQAHKLRTQLQALRTLLTQQNQALERARQLEIDLESTVSQRTQSLALAAQRLESLSTVDGGTGVANRRRFDETLLVEWGRAARDKRPLSIALIDVDWFKSYNDHYGHPAGDECLRQLARVFEAGVMRSGDLIARYGGEEFVLLAPDTDNNGIQTIANYLCQEVFALEMPHDGSHYGRVSVSIGVATAYPHKGSKASILVDEADAALYRAKAQGRHRVAGP